MAGNQAEEISIAHDIEGLEHVDDESEEPLLQLDKEKAEQERRHRLKFQNILRIGAPKFPLTDLYGHLQNLSDTPAIHWTLFFVLASTIWVIVAALFGLLYLPVRHSITPVPANYAEAFYFSLGIATKLANPVIEIGTAAHILSNIESFAYTMLTAILAGLVFNRFTRPSVNVIFSKTAIVRKCNGKPALQFRIANVRGNEIVSATLTVMLALNEKMEDGEVMRRLYPLKLERERSMIFRLTWTAIHIIDESSRLSQETKKTLLGKDAEILILFKGFDRAFGKIIHKTHEYVFGADIMWGAKYVDTLYSNAAGKRCFDLTNFHKITYNQTQLKIQ